jgi:phospholipase C
VLRLWHLNALGFNSDEAVYAGQAAAIAGDPALHGLFPVFRAHPLLFQMATSLIYRVGVSDLAPGPAPHHHRLRGTPMNPRQLAAAAIAAAAVGAVLAMAPQRSAASTGASHTPVTHIHHFVVLLQENHTFDNYFGIYPGADGIPSGVCMPVNPFKGPMPCVRPFHIGNQSIVDLDHSQYSARLDLHKGGLDGFVRAQHVRSGSGSQAMGYYNGSNVPFYWNVADRYVLFDHFFSSMLGGSFLNHVFWVAAGTGNATQTVPQGGLKVTTIFDRLQQAGISWKFYVQDYKPAINYRALPHLKNANRDSQPIWCPLLDIPRFLDNPALRSHIVDLSQYYTDLRNGTLPQVAYITSAGTSEHPLAA